MISRIIRDGSKGGGSFLSGRSNAPPPDTTSCRSKLTISFDFVHFSFKYLSRSCVTSSMSSLNLSGIVCKFCNINFLMLISESNWFHLPCSTNCWRTVNAGTIGAGCAGATALALFRPRRGGTALRRRRSPAPRRRRGPGSPRRRRAPMRLALGRLRWGDMRWGDLRWGDRPCTRWQLEEISMAKESPVGRLPTHIHMDPSSPPRRRAAVPCNGGRSARARTAPTPTTICCLTFWRHDGRRARRSVRATAPRRLGHQVPPRYRLHCSLPPEVAPCARPCPAMGAPRSWTRRRRVNAAATCARGSAFLFDIRCHSVQVLYHQLAVGGFESKTRFTSGRSSHSTMAMYFAVFVIFSRIKRICVFILSFSSS